MKVGILNITGYAGLELARILTRHREVDLVVATGRSEAGKPLGDVFPHLGSLGLTIQEEITENVDLVFSALPHQASAEICVPLLDKGVRVIDISADFRLRSQDQYELWYGVKHPSPKHLNQAVYGLPEIYRSQISSGTLIANPGCYPTSIILGLVPALKAGIIDPEIIADSKSGVSGAGRSGNVAYNFSEVNESVRAYGLEGHRHLPEIVQELNAVSAEQTRVTFVPHLIPMTRGILSACYAPIRDSIVGDGEKELKMVRDLYREFYENEPFVTVAEQPPATKLTAGNNQCIIYPTIDHRTNRLIVISCLDNLVKGAAGQAVQNMNLMLKLPETEGLEALALYP